MRRTSRQLLASVLKVDWSRFEGVAALRCTCGLAIPLVSGVASGSSSVAVFGALGAFGVGFGSFQGAYRSQAIPMVFAALAMAVSVLVGSLAGHSFLPAVAVVGLWGLGGGLLVALGQAASFVGLQSIIAVVIATGSPADVDGALGRAALVLGGGLAQTLLVLMVWPLRRFPAERRSLARVYRSLAAYASAIPQQDAPPEPHTLAGTLSPLADPQPFARAGETFAFQALLDEAERVRASLAALAFHRHRLVESDRACAASVSELSGSILAELADSLEHGREPRGIPELAASLRACASRLPPAVPVDPLLAQLHAACQTARTLAAVPRRADVSERAERRRRRAAVRDALITLRANLSPDSTAWRHAVRLGAAVLAAEAAARLFQIPRGYWLPLTVAVMLKPDFHDTFAASIARVGGTVLGAGGAVALAHAVGGGPAASVPIILLAVWAAYALAAVNAVAFAICVTAYVVFLLTLSGVPEGSAAADRTINTAIAGALALCAYSMWPTWTATGMRATVAARLDAHAGYLRALLMAYSDPAGGPARLDDLRTRARRARSNAEALVERTFSEPYRRHPMDARTATGLLAANRRVALAALALHAALQRDDGSGAPQVEPLAREVDRSLTALASSVRDGSTPPEVLPDLHMQFTAAAVGEVARDEISVIVDGVETMADLLRADHDRAARTLQS